MNKENFTENEKRQAELKNANVGGDRQWFIERLEHHFRLRHSTIEEKTQLGISMVIVRSFADGLCMRIGFPDAELPAENLDDILDERLEVVWSIAGDIFPLLAKRSEELRKSASNRRIVVPSK